MATLSMAECCWAPSRGVSSFGMVVVVMRIRSVGGICKTSARRGKEKESRNQLSSFKYKHFDQHPAGWLKHGKKQGTAAED